MDNGSIKRLAINPGSRCLGFAVFYNDDLVDWGLRTIPRVNSQSLNLRGAAVLTRIFGTHQIDRLILKSLHRARSSAALRGLGRALKGVAERRKVRLCEYDLKDIKRTLADEGRRNKAMVMRSVVERYSFLTHDLDKAIAERRPYSGRMLEAVAFGIHDLIKTEEKIKRSVK